MRLPSLGEMTFGGASAGRRLVAAFAICGCAAAAGAPAPYLPDAATLHLWHLDESEPPFMDWGVNPQPMWGLLNGATAGVPAMEGFGTALNFMPGRASEADSVLPYGPILLAQPELDSGPLDNVNPPFQVTGAGGAFTIEALVKLKVLPKDSPGHAADIVTMDDDIQANRVFLFRIEKPGFLSFLPISGDAVRGGGLATIPTTGPHAINTTDWFHVAVTYDGNENVANNLKLYWTRMGDPGEAANRIGSGTLTADLRTELADFAIGNSGKFNSLGPYEFFPGLLDEVRISSIAREAHDFFFVSADARRRAEAAVPGKRTEPRAELALHQVFIDETPARLPAAGDPLRIGPGSHRLDFDFGFPPGMIADPMTVKCRLEGIDDDWRLTDRGMTFTWEMLGANDETLARTSFAATRSSAGWESDLLDSRRVRHNEPLFVPGGTRRIRVTMSSGPPDTTGCWMIDNLSLTRSAEPARNLWANGDFESGERLNQIGGVPKGWRRGGTEPAIARVMLVGSPALGLLDAEQAHSAFWTCKQDLAVRPAAAGEIFLLSWEETFNVISGASLRATYTNVPPGKYTFRAISLAGNPVELTTQLALPIAIRQPYWKHAWFLPLIAVAAVMVVGWGLFLNYQRRSRNRIAAIKLANAVERDRVRIARDLHDDLGTRVSLLKHAASVVRGTLEREPAKASHQAARLESAASDLVRAMDGLVWAVNPSNDTLEHLASHLSGVAQEIFRDAPIRLRISIPTDLPAIRLSADFRHHFSLVVKEALHNILKHAGPCEATLKLGIEDRALEAVVSDTGAGFDPANPRAGNGLANLTTRAAEIRGSCQIRSTPGAGTEVVLRCPLPKVP